MSQRLSTYMCVAAPYYGNKDNWELIGTHLQGVRFSIMIVRIWPNYISTT